MRRYFSRSLLALSMLIPAPLAASGEWALCPGPLIPESHGDPAARDDPDTAATIEADRAEYDRASETYRFFGDVRLNRADQHAEADRLIYQQRSGRTELFGDVLYREQGLELTGSSGIVELRQDSGRVEDAQFRIEASHSHGSADKAVFVSRTVSRYRDVAYSTCEPGAEDWWLRAGRLYVDTGENFGSARHAWFSFQGVPLFYTPYITFPVTDERKSGLLAPSFGDSKSNGVTLTQPVYWNIAPNHDFTLTPSWYGHRGDQWRGQFRYLQPSLEGEMVYERLERDEQTREDRWLHRQNHRAEPLPGLNASVDYNRVSDTEYFDDFGTLEGTAPGNQLESTGRLDYAGSDWSAALLWQNWQNLDPDRARRAFPYERQPQGLFAYQPDALLGDLQFELESEAVRFRHEESQQRVTGDRYDATAALSYELRELGYFVVPRVAYRATGYEVQQPAPNAPTEPGRRLPIYSVDSGLILQRNFRWLDTAMQQTLEPRLFYLRVPYRDQEDLPLFDTGEPDLRMSRLFATNRFTGPDRHGDANHLAYALTTRFLNRGNGRNYLSLSAGQIHHLADRRVQRSAGADPETRVKSDYVFQARADLPGRLTLQWDYAASPYEAGFEESRASAQLRPADDLVLNLAYDIEWEAGEREREQTEGSLVLPLGPRLQLFGGWTYSHLHLKDVEKFGGVEYSECCWSVRFINRIYREDADDIADSGSNRAWLMEIEFKGLGGVGDTIVDFLDQTIPGYAKRY